MRLLFPVLLLFPSLVFAQPFPDFDVTVAWDAPTTYTDGNPVLPGDIAGYILCVGSSPIDPAVINCGSHMREDIPDGSATTYTFPYTPLAAAGTIYFRIQASDQQGRLSGLSGQAARPFVVGVPVPPGDVALGPPSNLRSE